MFAGLHDRLLLRLFQFSDDGAILLRMRLTQQLGYIPVSLTEAVIVIALAKGKKEYDKRQSIKEREDKREMDRMFKRWRGGIE